MKEIVVDCVKEINKIRTDPHYALKECERLLENVTDDNVYRRPGGMIISFNEGPSSLEDLRKDLMDLIKVSER